jgi:hypothetical protein
VQVHLLLKILKLQAAVLLEKIAIIGSNFTTSCEDMSPEFFKS